MNNCIVCGRPLLEEPLMVLEGMPASAQDIPRKEELQNDRGITLPLCQCAGCGLVQFDTVPVPYYKDVIRAGGYNATMRELRKMQYDRFIEKCGLQNKKIIEIGCGRGEFLRILAEYPVKAYGIEHKKDLVEIARQEGLSVQEGFVGCKTDRLPDGPYHAFLSFNFLEHQPDPNGMLQGIYENLTEDGVGLVTVPSLEYILRYDGFYELIRDHIAYYSLETLTFLLNKNGFEVIEHETVNRDTISVIVSKRKKSQIQAFRASYDLLNEELNLFFDDLLKKGKKAAIWGASHQGFTIASTAMLQDKVSYMIDSAPFKQGLFSPSSHIPIVSPDHFFDEPVDVILIIAPGYTEEISRIITERYGKKVEILTLREKHLEKVSE